MSDTQQDGTIAILNGQVSVTNPGQDGRAAVLVIPPDTPVIVEIDGDVVHPGRYSLTEQQKVAITPHKTAPVCNVKQRVTADKMGLILALELKPGTLRTPLQQAPAMEVTLTTEATPIPATPPSANQLRQTLEQGHYKGVVDEAALEELAQSTESTERLVLRGTPVYPGKPAECRPVPLPQRNEDDVLHRKMQLQSVQSGDVVAVIDEAVEPRPGLNILGQVIQFRGNFKSHLPRFGEGVKRITDKVYANRNGRLVFSSAQVDVVPNVELNQSITAKDGQVFFDGDVTVFGDVEDGSLINATGVVQIKGGVFGSTVVGERGVSIRGHCVKSKIFAGWGRELADEMLAATQLLKDGLGAYFTDVQRVLSDAQNKLGSSNPAQLTMVPWIVLDKYHASLPKAILGVVQEYARCNKHELGKQLFPVIRMIQTAWVGPKLKELTPGIIADLVRAVDDYITYLTKSLERDAAVAEINAVTSSTIEATGSIFVSGKGSYASELSSGHAIEVSGYVRGGTLSAVEAVSVRELGAPSGTETRVVVKSPTGSINVGTRHANTLLEVGGRLDRNTVMQRDIHFER